MWYVCKWLGMAIDPAQAQSILLEFCLGQTLFDVNL